MLGRNQQVDVPEDPTSRFVENEVTQGFIFGNEPRLFPNRLARRGRDPTDDDVSDFPFGVAFDKVDGPFALHCLLYLKRCRT